MSNIDCPGLDGANPLHFLAALGILRLLERDGLAPQLAWHCRNGIWHPVFSAAQLDLEVCCAHCATWLNDLGQESSEKSVGVANQIAEQQNKLEAAQAKYKILLKQARTNAKEQKLDKAAAKLFITAATKDQKNKIDELKIKLDEISGGARSVRDLGKKLKDAQSEFRAAQKRAREEAKAKGLIKAERRQYLDDAVREQRCCAERLGNEMAAAQFRRADTLGNGLAHFGDNLNVNPKTMRLKQLRALETWFKLDDKAPRTADAVLVAGQLAALCFENGQDVKRTPYSFGNGGSGQNMLKDFRLDARACKPENIRYCLLGDGRRFINGRKAGVRSLGWDPSDQVSYALSWQNPEDIEKHVDIAANALAYIGMGCLCVMPAMHGECAVGWDSYNKTFKWIVWEPAISLQVVSSLLALDEPFEKMRMRGILEVFSSRRIDPTRQSRFYFTPARPVL